MLEIKQESNAGRINSGSTAKSVKTQAFYSEVNSCQSSFGRVARLFSFLFRNSGPPQLGRAHLRLESLCVISLAENCLNLGLRRQQPSWRLWVCTVAVFPTWFSPLHPAAPS